MPGQADSGPDAEAAGAARLIGLFNLRGDDAANRDALDALAAADAEGLLREARDRSVRAFADAGRPLPTPHVEGGLILGDRDNPYFMRTMRGYSGSGSVPGYVNVTIWPTDYTLPRLRPAAAHEYHHNVRLSYAPFTPNISVAEYIVLEGLAESFAAALYGHDLIGPWVTTLNEEETARSKGIIGGALDVSCFDKVRPYIFGDDASGFAGDAPIGLPFCAGYTIGFHVVQSYLRRTGRTIVEATFTPAAGIVAESRYFA